MTDEYKTRNQMIMNEINRVMVNVVGCESKIKFIDICDSETGEILEESIPVNKKVMNSKDVKGNCAKPFVRCTLNKLVLDRYLRPLGNADFRRVYELIFSLDAFGRIKYGENIQQYCRNYEDIGKIVDLNGRQLQRFIKNIRDLQIIRVVTIDKALLGTEQYITINPAIAVNGVFFDRLTAWTWYDVIQEFKLLSSTDLRYILKGEKVGIEGVPIK